MRIGVFDSGLGGLTVLKNLYKHYPNNEYIYYGDTLNLPYGSKSKEELIGLASNDIEFLLTKQVDIIIIACGTVSSNCLEYLKNRYDIPIYDIITPTINYLNNSNYSNVGIIATERTIDSDIFKKKLIKNVYQIKTPKLVPMIENNNLSDIDNILDTYLSKYKNKIDILVLGCTHYPIIKKHINKYFNNKIDLLDMSDPILPLLKEDNTSNITIYFSKNSSITIKQTKNILELDNLNILEKTEYK
ncbi:MAG: glutamate racemase [Bacilli bacterium]|nr:glutamate racemase [Bacilli bacterium]